MTRQERLVWGAIQRLREVERDLEALRIGLTCTHPDEAQLLWDWERGETWRVGLHCQLCGYRCHFPLTPRLEAVRMIRKSYQKGLKI